MLENDLVHEKAVKIAAYEQQIKDDCQEKSQKLYLACNRKNVPQNTFPKRLFPLLALPNDEMKGQNYPDVRDEISEPSKLLPVLI